MTRSEPYEFKDTGVTVEIRKVSPLLMLQLQNRYPEPKPPLQEVDYGDGPVKEPNPTAPEHLVALRQYQQDMELRMRRLLIQRGVKIDWTEERKQELAELREWWKEQYGEELPEKDDVVAYVSYIAVGSDKDYEELTTVILQRSQPTEAKIAETAERLKS